MEIRHLLQLDKIRKIENINLALDAYIEKVESLGVAVFQLSLTQDNLRGFAIVDDIIPIIGIKRGGEQAQSKIFTLFHEVWNISGDYYWKKKHFHHDGRGLRYSPPRPNK